MKVRATDKYNLRHTIIQKDKFWITCETSNGQSFNGFIEKWGRKF